MATPAELSALRSMVAEPEEDSEWTDAMLTEVLADTDSPRAAAAVIWERKAASLATLVNVSESGSSRNLGDLYRNALAMTAQFRSDAASSPVSTRGARVRRIVRQ